MPVRNLPALCISVVMHIAVLAGLFFWKLSVEQKSPRAVVETVFLDERPQEEFTQEMSLDTSVSNSLSVTAGGTVTGQIGRTEANPVGQHIEQSQALQQPQINVTQFASVSLPGIGDVNLDLGEGEVSGEVGARAEGYGAAMHRMTQELRRMMRDGEVIVVWLLDGTLSLKDDRQEIAENFSKIYDELDLARQQAETKKQKYHALETMICSFGQRLQKITPKPTSDLKEIKAAIERIKDVDNTGVENLFGSLGLILDEYGKIARSSNRRLAIIVLTDEVGDDVNLLEDVVDRAKLYKSPIYFFGREATFGYPYARLKWTNPETKVDYWVDIQRGPETAMPEALQYTGFGGRWDSSSSGFACYPQARLVKESGGIYFMLQSEEQDLIDSANRLARKFDDIRMKQYEPQLISVRDYVRDRDKSDFRKTVWQVILRLNPHLDQDLGIQDHYSIDQAEFRKQGAEAFRKGVRAMQLMNAALADLEKVKKHRDTEPDARWRATFDLTYAQLMAYRVRVFQFLLAIDLHAETNPKPKSPKSNRWDRNYSSKMLEPTEKQVKASGVDTAELEKQRKTALQLYALIEKEHPGTPWAQRAGQERRWGFGINFVDRFYDPKYFDPAERAKIPKF